MFDNDGFMKNVLNRYNDDPKKHRCLRIAPPPPPINQVFFRSFNHIHVVSLKKKYLHPRCTVLCNEIQF